MKNFILFASVLMFSLPALAETLVCRRVIEVEGARDFVYETAPRVATRVPTIKVDTTNKIITYRRLKVDGTIYTGTSPYIVAPPSEEFEGNSLSFKTDVGEAMFNFVEKQRGRFAGSTTKYVIGEFYEGDLDSTSWSYLCPLEISSEVE